MYGFIRHDERGPGRLTRNYTVFQIIMQIVYKCHKDYTLCFSIKLMDGIVWQGSLDH